MATDDEGPPPEPASQAAATTPVPRAAGSAAPRPPVAAGAPGSIPPGPSDLERAIGDVVARTGADAADVTVIAHEEVTWRDAGAGCPQKGMQYLQVLTDGMRIILEVDGRRFHYHAGGRRDLFYCATPQAPVGE